MKRPEFKSSFHWFDPSFWLVSEQEIEWNYAMSRYIMSQWHTEPFLSVLRGSHYPDADWWLSLFPFGINYGTCNLIDVKRIFLNGAGPNDNGRSSYFAALFCSDMLEERILLETSMSKGYPMSFFKFTKFAQFSAGMNIILKKGAELNSIGCCSMLADEDEHKYILQRSRLGDYWAFVRCSIQFCINDKRRWNLLFLYAKNQDMHGSEGINHWFREIDGVFDTSTLFYISELTKQMGLIQPKNRKIDILAYRRYVINRVQQECITWILTGKRMGVVKDIRGIIAKKIWNSRKEGRKILKI